MIREKTNTISIKLIKQKKYQILNLLLYLHHYIIIVQYTT